MYLHIADDFVVDELGNHWTIALNTPSKEKKERNIKTAKEVARFKSAGEKN